MTWDRITNVAAVAPGSRGSRAERSWLRRRPRLRWFVVTADDENDAHDVLVDQPEVVAQGATVEQYASVVAAYRATLEEWIAYEDTCSDVDCLIHEPEHYAALAAKLVAFNHVLVTVGDPDADIAALVERTIGDTRTAIDAVNAFTSCAESGTLMNECADVQAQAETAWRTLPAMFAAWDPYL